MWAIVLNGQVHKVLTQPKPITIGDVNYPKNIFTIWSASELEALGIFEVSIDNSNLKNKEYYINTNMSFDFINDEVIGSYGLATAKPLDDILFTAQDEIDGFGTEGTVKQSGLRQGLIDNINQQAGSILLPTDWMVIKSIETGVAVSSDITTFRAAVRAQANTMVALIESVSDVDALAALYIYTNDDMDDATPPVRPLGQFPTL